MNALLPSRKISRQSKIGTRSSKQKMKYLLRDILTELIQKKREKPMAQFPSIEKVYDQQIKKKLKT